VCNGNNLDCALVSSVVPRTVRNSEKITLMLSGASFPPKRIWVAGVDVTDHIEGYSTSSCTFSIKGFELSSDELTRHVPIKVEVIHKRTRLSTTFDFEIEVVTNLPLVERVREHVLNTQTQHTLHLEGQNFLLDMPASCVFRDLGHFPVQTTPATVVSEQLVTCDAPIRQFSRTPGVKVDLVWGVYEHVSQLVPFAGDNTLQYYEPAPRPTHAQFTPDGGAILVHFDSPVFARTDPNAWSANPSSCRRFLDMTPRDGIYFGMTDVDCSASLVSPTILRIGFSAQYLQYHPKQTPAINSTVYLKRDVFYRELAVFSFPVDQDVVIGDSDDYERPSLVVHGGPFHLGKCGTLVLDMSESTGDGGRLFQRVDVYVTVKSPDQQQIVDSDTILSNSNSTYHEFVTRLVGDITSVLLRKASSRLRYLEFSSEHIPEGLYTVAITAENFLYRWGSTLINFQKTNDRMIPLVLFRIPHSVSVSQPLELVADIQMGCDLADHQVAVSWGDLQDIARNDLVVLPASQRTLSTAIVPPFSLKGGHTYSLNVSVAFINMLFIPASMKEPTRFYTTTVSVYVEECDLAVSIGQEMTVSADHPLHISAAIHDECAPSPSLSSHLELSEYKVQWACYTPLNGFDCLHAVTGELLHLPSEPELLLSEEQLAPNVYHFTASVIHLPTGRTAVSSELRVHRQAKKMMPSVSLAVSDLSPSTNSELVLTATVSYSNLNDSRLLLSWVSKPECQGRTYATLNLFDTIDTIDFKLRKVLRLKQGILNPGSSYCISTVAFDPTMPHEAEATVTFTVPNAPFAGTCSVLKDSTLSAYTDTFRFMCDGWETTQHALPLSYYWEAKPKGARDVHYVLLDPPDHDSEFASLFPPGEYTVRATVADSQDAHNQVEQVMNIVATPPPADSALKPAEHLDQALTLLRKEYAQKRQARRYISQLAALSMGLSQVDPADRHGIDWKIATDLSQLVPLVWMDAYRARQVLTILTQLTGPSRDNVAIQQALLSVIRNCLDGLLSQAYHQPLDKDTAYYLNHVADDLLFYIHRSTLTPSATLFDTQAAFFDTLDRTLTLDLLCGEKFVLERSGHTKTLVRLEVDMLPHSALSPSTALSLCGFDLPIPLYRRLQDQQGCLAAICTQTKSANILAYQGSLRINPTAIHIEFITPHSSDTNTLREGALNSSLPYDEGYVANVPIHPWFRDSLVNASCVIYDHDAQDWSPNYCTLLSYDSLNSVATCACSRWGMIGIALPNPESTLALNEQEVEEEGTTTIQKSHDGSHKSFNNECPKLPYSRHAGVLAAMCAVYMSY
jgi:hypothetical protein